MCTALTAAEGSHESSQSGPITASTMPACIMRAIAAVACGPSQPTSSHTYDSFTRNFSFASVTASEMAPADGISWGQESTVGNKIASRIAAIDAWFHRTSAPASCEQGKKARHNPNPEMEGSTGQHRQKGFGLEPGPQSGFGHYEAQENRTLAWLKSTTIF